MAPTPKGQGAACRKQHIVSSTITRTRPESFLTVFLPLLFGANVGPEMMKPAQIRVGHHHNIRDWEIVQTRSGGEICIKLLDCRPDIDFYCMTKAAGGLSPFICRVRMPFKNHGNKPKAFFKTFRTLFAVHCDARVKYPVRSGYDLKKPRCRLFLLEIRRLANGILRLHPFSLSNRSKQLNYDQ